MLKTENLRFRYGKRSPFILDGVSFELKDGEVGIVLGKNGSGKTTLFRCILGINSFESGSIEFDGADLLKMPKRKRAELTAYVPQNIRFGALTVFDTVLMGRVRQFGLKAGRSDYEAVERVLRETGLEELAAKNAEELSGGERQKTAIARAIAQEPRLMIFDEPTGNLDIANEQLIMTEARRLAREKNMGILSSLHDLNTALAFGDRFFFMKDGRIKYSGGKGDVTEEILKDIFGVNVRTVTAEGQKIILTGGNYEY